MALLDLCLSSSHGAQDVTSLAALDSEVGQAEQPPSTAPPQGLKRRKAQMSGSLPLAQVPVKDGHHWLKYGEKLLRDCCTLRHYYRCGQRAETGCPAKKMVDVLVPTGACHCLYRDVHNHLSPPTTTALSSSPSTGRPLPPHHAPLSLQLRAPLAPLPGPLPGLPAPPLDLNTPPDPSAAAAASAASVFAAANLAVCMSLLSRKQQISRTQSPQAPPPAHYGYPSHNASGHGQASRTLGTAPRPSAASPGESNRDKGACTGAAYVESSLDARSMTQNADAERRLQQHLVDLKHWLLVPRAVPADVSPDAALISSSGVSLGLQKFPRTGNSPGVRRKTSSVCGNLGNLRATISSPVKR